MSDERKDVLAQLQSVKTPIELMPRFGFTIFYTKTAFPVIPLQSDSGLILELIIKVQLETA